ncbi:MAG TPA: Fic family protein [Candidatus Nanoarchaeia archaeon]
MFIPKFNITNQVLTNIGQIEASKAVIENSPLVPAYEAKFRQEAIVRTVHHGTHIEGNPLEQPEVEKVLAGRDVPARDRDIQEILNYREVLKFINAKKDEPVTEKILLEIHKLTTKKILKADEAGKYRYTQVRVTNSKTGETSYLPPPPGQIADLIRRYLLWLNQVRGDETHPVIKAAITHYVVVAIHPFIDGNGRAARALSTLVLFKEDYDIKKFFSLEEYFDRDSASYYSVLQKTSNQSKKVDERDLTSWIEYFTQGLANELARVREKVQRLSADLKLKGKMGQVPLNERQLKLVEYMQKAGQVSNKEWREFIPMVSDDTILRELKYLMKKGLVKKRGRTKSASYMLK